MGAGRFVTVEGGEGAGKSTQLRFLAASLRADGCEVIETREPGGSPGAEAIRALLVNGETERWDGLAETLLHSAARRDHLARTVWPALERGAWVLCDRFADSTLAYQGWGHGVPPADIATVTRLVAGAFKPDLTLILDLPVEVGLARARERGAGGEDRYERLGVDFHRRLREGFLAIAAAEPGRCAVIDATRPLEEVRDAIRAEVARRLGPSR